MKTIVIEWLVSKWMVEFYRAVTNQKAAPDFVHGRIFLIKILSIKNCIVINVNFLCVMKNFNELVLDCKGNEC